MWRMATQSQHRLMKKPTRSRQLTATLANGLARFRENSPGFFGTTAGYYNGRINKWLGMSVPALLVLSLLFDISDYVIGAPGKAFYAARDYFFLTHRIEGIQKRMEEEALYYRCNIGGIRFQVQNTKALDHDGRKLLLKYISNGDCSEDFAAPPSRQQTKEKI